jgi:hypothetical protein
VAGLLHRSGEQAFEFLGAISIARLSVPVNGALE